jgi:hypothetical protein
MSPVLCEVLVGMRAADGATLVGVPQLTGLPKICADAVLR